MKRLAIIGASSGQLPLVNKAKELGHTAYCFAWERGAVCKNICDRFFPISISETDKIADICRELKVDGVVTNASEETAMSASIVANELGLNTTPPEVISTIQNKQEVRKLTRNIPGLSNPMIYDSLSLHDVVFPCVVKPIKGSAKKGVSFCKNEDELYKAIEYAGGIKNGILVEEFILGREFSVESLSFKGKHYVVQITDKQSSGPPHFVELAHHQPSSISDGDKNRVKKCVSSILNKVGFENGPTHIEMKLNEETGELYLIEINCRGGGDHISDTLVNLSTDCDYIKEMIDIALGRYTPRKIKNIGCSGICYLCNQTKHLLKYFGDETPKWLLIRERTNDTLSSSTTNYDRDGYFIYAADKKPDI